MRKIELKIIANLATVFLLCMILVISVSYGWYTNNKEVNANGILASSASESLSVTNQGAFREEITDKPYPDEDPKDDIVGVLSGDIVYFSISLTSEEVGTKDVEIKISELFGGEYFTSQAIEIDASQYSSLAVNETNKVYTSTENNSYTVYSLNGEVFYIKLINNEYYKGVGTVTDGKFTPSTSNLIKLEAKPDLTNASIVSTYYVLETNDYKTYTDDGGEYYLRALSEGYQKIYIYETTETDGSKRRYNMLDVYTYEIYKIFGRKYEVVDGAVTNNLSNDYIIIKDVSKDEDGNIIYNPISFEKENPTDKGRSMCPLYTYQNWCNDPNQDNYYAEITFTIKIVFDYSNFIEKHPDINMSSVSNKRIEFNNIIIYETEVEE